MVLTTLASETKPFGYALAALYVAKQGLQMVMDWQVHRAELSSRKAGLTTDEVAPGEAGAVGTNVVLEMLQASGTRPAPENYEAQEGAAQAVRVLVRRPLVRVEQGDGQAP